MKLQGSENVGHRYGTKQMYILLSEKHYLTAERFFFCFPRFSFTWDFLFPSV